VFFKKFRTPRKKLPGKPLPEVKLSAQAAALEKYIVEEIEIGDVRSPTAAIAPPRPRKASPAWLSLKAMAGCLGLWLLLITASLFARSAWPVDETRVLAVAWEMWTRHENVLPYLNGVLYAGQPPLLPWLIHAGWGVFGVNDWWPRLLPSLFALGSLVVTGRLARMLWRENPDIARYAPLVLVGTLLWAGYTTLALPDMLLAFFTLIGWWAVLMMWRHRDMRAFLLLGTALGLGALALGLAIFMYLLPVALLAPLWVKERSRITWKYWYTDIAKATALGVAILCLWLVPAAAQAGLPYILRWFSISLTAARLDLLPAVQPWWWYLPWLPILCLPWSIWPLLWMRLWHIRREPLNTGMLFCLIGTLSTLAVLSLLDVKQAQFLLPLLPLVALAVAYLLMDEAVANVGQEKLFSGMALPIIVLGGVFAVLPHLPRVEFLPPQLWELSPFVGLSLMLVGIALAWLPVGEVRRRALDTVVSGALLVVFVILGAGWRFDAYYRSDAVSEFLAQMQAQHRPVASVGDYQGEFQFSGRLPRPLQVIDASQAENWSAAHPDGVLMAYAQTWQPPGTGVRQPALQAAYRGQILRLWYAGIPVARVP
jgi:4-amino-4-deoxy-L-arabinose transferase-like glycosyltransferase